MSNAPPPFPDVVMIVGTDASGKDHITAILEKMIRSSGAEVEKRKRYLSGKITRKRSSCAKPRHELLLEHAFLLLFPYLGWVLPWLLNLALRYDLNRYQPASDRLIVIGHNCLRGLAFYWGHKYSNVRDIPISPSLQRTLASLRSLPGLQTLVLDIDNVIRRHRITEREALGTADYFDRYMAQNELLSERIESFLVWLSITYLEGKRISNNDLSDEELKKELREAFNRS